MVGYKLFMDPIRDIIGLIWLDATALMHLKFFISQLNFFLLSVMFWYPNLLSRGLWKMFMNLSSMCITLSFSKQSLTISKLILLLPHHVPTNISKKHWAQVTYKEMALVCLWASILLQCHFRGFSHPSLCPHGLSCCWTLLDAPVPYNDIPWLGFLHQTVPTT